MADEDPTVDTDESASAQVTRSLEQGLGVGARELDAQREPAADPPLADADESED